MKNNIKSIKNYKIAENIGKKSQFDSYWCYKCHREHKKFAKKDIYSLIFAKHIEYKSDLTTTQLILKKIKRSWQLYAKSKKYLINKKEINKDQEKINKLKIKNNKND